MKIQPLADRIVAKAIEQPTKTAAGILLPDSAKTATQTAEVIAVGKDVKEIKVGDQIIHSAGYDVKEVKIDSIDYLLIKEEDVLAVVA